MTRAKGITRMLHPVVCRWSWGRLLATLSAQIHMYRNSALDLQPQ